MTKHRYLCYFDEWSDFMDGTLYVDNGEEGIDLDFQCNDPILAGEGSDHVLEPFTEQEARLAIASLLDCKASDILFDYGASVAKWQYLDTEDNTWKPQ